MSIYTRFMADPLIVPDICRFLVKQVFRGIPLLNVIDIKITLPTVNPTDRADRCFDQAGRLLNAFDDKLRIHQVDDLTCQSVDWMDLDSVSGSVGSRSTTSANSWPATGASAAAPLPSFVALRLEKRTVAQRGQRAGRMFLCGINEVWTASANGQEIDPVTLASIQVDVEAFRTSLAASSASGGQGYDSKMVIVHKPKIGIASASDVTSLVALPTVTHQIRRR